MTAGKHVHEGVAAGVAQIARLTMERSPTLGKARCVAVDGPAGSGKTTFAQTLRATLDARGAASAVLHMDDLYEGWSSLQGGAGRRLEERLLEQVLQPWAEGADARWQRYDWAAERFAEWHELPVADVLILEGCGSGARAYAPYLTVLVWLDAALHTRLSRGIERDGEAMRQQWEAWMRSEASYFAAQGTKRRADVQLSTG